MGRCDWTLCPKLVWNNFLSLSCARSDRLSSRRSSADSSTEVTLAEDCPPWAPSRSVLSEELVVLGFYYCQWVCVRRALSPRPNLWSMYVFAENSVSSTHSVVTDVCLWRTLSPWLTLCSLMCMCGELCLRDPPCGHWCVYGCALSPLTNSVVNVCVCVCVCIYRGPATLCGLQRSVWVGCCHRLPLCAVLDLADSLLG